MKSPLRPPVGKVDTHLTASARPHEVQCIDPFCSGRGHRFLFQLVNPIHDGVEAAMAIDVVPISIRDGSPEGFRF